MSSLHRAFKSHQRVHRERVNVLTQGFLERKKDYQVRAAEYNRRNALIKTLKKKTLDKNPDEFHFGMKKARLVNGVHTQLLDDDDEEVPVEELKLMETQDMNYVNYRRSIDIKKIEKLQNELHLIDSSVKPPNKHTFFVDSKEEKKNFDIADRMKMDKKLLKMGFNFANPERLAKVSIDDIERSNEIKMLKYRRLENKMKREETLKAVNEKMLIKKHLLNKKEKAKKLPKSQTGGQTVYHWKTERKKWLFCLFACPFCRM